MNFAVRGDAGREANDVGRESTSMLPKLGDSLVKRVARSYTPSEKAQALEHAALHG